MSAGICTRCCQVGLIRLRGDLAFGVPYALCTNCHGVLQGLDDAEHAAFAADLWRRAVVAQLEPYGMDDTNIYFNWRLNT